MEATASTRSAAGEDLRPFTVDLSEDQIDDLRDRIRATRLPRKETVDDISQGIFISADASDLSSLSSKCSGTRPSDA